MRAASELHHKQAEGRSAYLFVIEGELHVNGEILREGDAARITRTSELALASITDSFFMLIDLP
ncbi:hypothetical protein D3C73_1474290 [compost metagenome]